jgi:hypothetical protein
MPGTVAVGDDACEFVGHGVTVGRSRGGKSQDWIR